MSESKNRLKLPREVDEQEKMALAPHVQSYAQAQAASKQSYQNIDFLCEKFAGKGSALHIDDEGEWTFVKQPISGPQIMPSPAESDEGVADA